MGTLLSYILKERLLLLIVIAVQPSPAGTRVRCPPHQAQNNHDAGQVNLCHHVQFHKPYFFNVLFAQVANRKVKKKPEITFVQLSTLPVSEKRGRNPPNTIEAKINFAKS